LYNPAPSPPQTHVINLLGRDITITLTATNYEWNWGDGTTNLVTTSTGSVWSEGMDLNTDPERHPCATGGRGRLFRWW